MAADKVDLRDVSLRQLFPWTELFRGFQVALDPKKLLLAAAGIVVMAFGWWLLSVIFYAGRTEPDWNSPAYQTGEGNREAEWDRFKVDRRKWNLLVRAAAPGPQEAKPEDLADTYTEYQQIKPQWDEGKRAFVVDGKTLVAGEKPYGELRTWPWFENRGPNPYLLVTGQAGYRGPEGQTSFGPWERGHFWDWLFTKQVPVLIEPLIKFLKPIVFLLQTRAGFWNRLYFSLVLLWTLATWALFGGAITRLAVVQVARKDKISMGEAVRFSLSRYLSLFSAPLFPLLCVLVIVIFLVIYGFFHLIPWFGDVVVDGLGWPLVILAGLAMAVVLVGLVGWPMMYATISAEGSDSFDALSRSYSYVYQNPWQYLWYAVVSLVYGAAVVFFVVFMGSLMVYLGKWGVGQTPFLASVDREPEFLFIYAPTSFGWRELLLHGSPALTAAGGVDPGFVAHLSVANKVGAFMVAVWLYLVFLMVIGFAYSYFWSASTIIYLLMRRKVDDTELDEIYLEDEDAEEAYSPAGAPPATPSANVSEPPLTMVESPTLRTSVPPAAPPSGREGSPRGEEAGSSPAGGPASA